MLLSLPSSAVFLVFLRSLIEHPTLPMLTIDRSWSQMATQERPYEPPWTFRTSSAATVGIVGALSRIFLYGLSKTETQGLDIFLELVDNRRDGTKRERGLITISNHLCVYIRSRLSAYLWPLTLRSLDDPMIWGVLPFRYHWNPNNMRWSLGSYDICFKNG